MGKNNIHSMSLRLLFAITFTLVSSISFAQAEFGGGGGGGAGYGGPIGGPINGGTLPAVVVTAPSRSATVPTSSVYSAPAPAVSTPSVPSFPSPAPTGLTTGPGTGGGSRGTGNSSNNKSDKAGNKSNKRKVKKAGKKFRLSKKAKKGGKKVSTKINDIKRGANDPVRKEGSLVQNGEITGSVDLVDTNNDGYYDTVEVQVTDKGDDINTIYAVELVPENSDTSNNNDSQVNQNTEQPIVSPDFIPLNTNNQIPSSNNLIFTDTNPITPVTSYAPRNITIEGKTEIIEIGKPIILSEKATPKWIKITTILNQPIRRGPNDEYGKTFNLKKGEATMGLITFWDTNRNGFYDKVDVTVYGNETIRGQVVAENFTEIEKIYAIRLAPDDSVDNPNNIPMSDSHIPDDSNPNNSVFENIVFTEINPNGLNAEDQPDINPQENQADLIEEEKPNKRKEDLYYYDADGDGYHSKTTLSSVWPPVPGYSLSTNGIDCDDTNPAVHSLNSCGKCKLEPRLKTWTAHNLEQNATGLLKEMIDRARALAPNLNIVKANNQKVGAGTSIPCDRIVIGGGINNVTANSALAFELSHVINRAQDISLRNRLFTGISRSEFVKRSLEIEAEGSLFASIIRKRESPNQNDCETRNLQINLTNNPVDAHSGMSLAQIKSDIRSSGELEQRRKELQNSGNATVTGVSASKKYEDVYNQTINYINYYRKFERETDQQIKARLAKNNNCN